MDLNSNALNSPNPLHPLYILLLFCFSCQPEPCASRLAFYHWKTSFSPDSLANTYLEKLLAERLYLRLFDVDWDPNLQAPYPKAVAQFHTEPNASLETVPTLYITNRTMINCSPEQVEELVHRVKQKIAERLPFSSIPEVQIDCDWTERSQQAYFTFLRKLQEELPEHVALSATLRLHQYRWPEKTGVPPVDRTMLMYYNMGDLEDWSEPNSILNLDKAEAYLQHTNEYPLPIDIALPLFRWGVLFRHGKMIKLINGLATERVLAAGGQPIDEQQSRFSIPESTYLDGYYLYAGDEIRLEWISPEDLMDAAEQLQVLACKGQRYLAFYHLDSMLLHDFPVLSLRSVQQVLDQEMDR